MADLPPPETVALWEVKLKTVPARHRDDARSEAYLAYYEGRDPVKAIGVYNSAERRREKRELPIHESDGEHFAYDPRTGETVDESRFTKRKTASPRQSIPVRNNPAA